MDKSPPLYEIDFRATQFSRNPYPTYETLRKDFPVCRLADGTHLLSRYEDVKFALKNYDLFSSGWSDAPIIHPVWLSDECKRGAFLPELDPPLHTKYRAIVKNFFIGKSLKELAPAIQITALDLIKQIENGRKHSFDILTDFSYPLASSIVENITGLNISEDIHRTREWIELLESFTSDSPDPTKQAAIETMIKEQNAYYDDLINSRRRYPKNDLATALANAAIDGEPLPADQLRSALNLFTLGGFEAPGQLLAKSILILSRRPELKRALLTDPDKIYDFIEEMTRFGGAAQGLMRMTKEEIVLHDTTIPPKSVVLALVGSANRDPDQFHDPDNFLLGRHNVKTHLGFGHGAHICIGAALARLEVRIGLQVFFSTFNDFSCPNDEELDWYSTPYGRVLRSLNVHTS